MNSTEFIDRMIGVPWVNRACSFTECDCWGMIVLYYRHVMNIEIPVIDDYVSNADFNDCFSIGISRWEKIESPCYGGMVAAYYGNKPIHVGITIGNRVLHSRGESDAVRFDRLKVFERVYTKLEFYRYAEN
ncbi:NlpC/P60 family protein [Pectobacterium versatile]|uniref:NlpC/P60 family protein n=1 Tax=Pectobacterium versatile TaxID=2488639 RepID=UPI00208614A1|nr:hypothetical protein SOASR014_41570 [Pectobacterium carotovorum subsp. carotovorum]GLX46566.1 hypothetical protein Pcaca01_42340 [Pectobacterium carotovorum subsp. carotovorum]